MALQVLDRSPRRPDAERLAYAREIIRGEAAALEQVAGRLDDSFLQAVDLLYRCPGRVALTGTGKSADVGQKIAGTLNSTGTRAYVLDATRAVHGDLGMVHPNDVALVLSHSGESEEIIRLLGPMRQLAMGIIGITGNARGALAGMIVGLAAMLCIFRYTHVAFTWYVMIGASATFLVGTVVSRGARRKVAV